MRERLDRVRSELDDWVQEEYDRQELGMERFSAMYYGALGTPFARRPTFTERSALLAAIDRIREQVGALSRLPRAAKAAASTDRSGSPFGAELASRG